MSRALSCWILIAGLAITLPACATDASRLASQAVMMAQRSRVAALIGPDREYVRLLEDSIVEMTAQRADARDDMGLLLALDELAEIYAFRLVHFEKAVQVNAQATDVLNRIRVTGGIDRLGWFFNRNRGLYSVVVGPFVVFVGRGVRSPAAGLAIMSDERSQQPRDFVWQGKNRERLRSIYPDSFLRSVASHDLEACAQRIHERESILMTLSRGMRTTDEDEGRWRREGPDRLNPGREVALFEPGLSGVPEPYRSALLLERVWVLRGEMKPREAFERIIEIGARFLETETAAYREAHMRDAILARLRIDVAYLTLGRISEGVSLVEETQALLRQHDERLQQIQEEAKSLTWLRLSRGVLGMLGILAIAVRGAPNIAGIICCDMSAVFAAPGELRHIAALYSQKQGIAGVLTESEQLEFYVRLGGAYEAMGEVAKAITQYRKAIEIIERQRVTIRSEAGRIQYLGDKEAPYARLIPLLVRSGDPAGALEVAERARSRAFVELLAGGGLRFGTSEETARYELIVQRQMELDVLVQANGLPRSVAEEIYRTTRGGEAQPVAKPTPISLEFESLSSVDTAKIGDIAAVLGQEAALLAFFVGQEETSVLLVQDGTVSAWNRPIGRDALRGAVERIRAAVGQGASPSSGPANRAELDELTATLYRELLAPAFARLSKRVVYIAPHGPLHYVPFAAISDGREYLIDRYTLLTTPSGTVLTYLAKKQKPASATTVVLANPDVGDRRLDLPYAEREGAAIQARRADTMLFSRGAATKGRLREWAPKSGVLHLAAHARLDVRRPLESAVLLAPSDGDDGLLTAGEVFGLALPSTLVVLSACETGLGSVASGDELIGLTRAFMYAGAPQVVATLWRISDESTAQLMDDFYDQLRTRPAAEALRVAQLRLRARYPDPFHWAGFSVFGHFR